MDNNLDNMNAVPVDEATPAASTVEASTQEPLTGTADSAFDNNGNYGSTEFDGNTGYDAGYANNAGYDTGYGDNTGYNAGYDTGYANNSGFGDPGYTQPGYGGYGAQPDLQGFQPQVAKCPAKEIVGMVMGIHSLFWGVMGAGFGFIPYAGWIYAMIWGGFGIGSGIAGIILHKKVHEQADVITNKIEIGKKLSVAGIIVSIAGIVLSVVVGIIIMGLLIGGAAAASFSSSGYNP